MNLESVMKKMTSYFNKIWSPLYISLFTSFFQVLLFAGFLKVPRLEVSRTRENFLIRFVKKIETNRLQKKIESRFFFSLHILERLMT